MRSCWVCSDAPLLLSHAWSAGVEVQAEGLGRRGRAFFSLLEKAAVDVPPKFGAFLTVDGVPRLAAAAPEGESVGASRGCQSTDHGTAERGPENDPRAVSHLDAESSLGSTLPPVVHPFVVPDLSRYTATVNQPSLGTYWT